MCKYLCVVDARIQRILKIFETKLLNSRGNNIINEPLRANLHVRVRHVGSRIRIRVIERGKMYYDGRLKFLFRGYVERASILK